MKGIILMTARNAGKTAMLELMKEKMAGGFPDAVLVDSLGHMDMADLKTQVSEAFVRDQIRKRIKPSLTDMMGYRSNSEFDTWRKGLDEDTIVNEYFLIKEKKSALSRAKRDYIMRICK